MVKGKIKIIFSLSKKPCCLQAKFGGAELLRELELDFRDSELWLRDCGLSVAMAANSAIATGQHHSCIWAWWLPSAAIRIPNAWIDTAESWLVFNYGLVML